MYNTRENSTCSSQRIRFQLTVYTVRQIFPHMQCEGLVRGNGLNWEI